RLRGLSQQRVSFAFETTLASRSFAPWLEALKATGYRAHLVFLAVANADAAVARVEARAKTGGDSVPEETVRRRYVRGLRNLFDLYIPLSDMWQVYDNSGASGPG